MSRNLILILMAAATLFAQAAPKPASTASKKPVSALSKPALESYLRHLFVWPDAIQVTINDPKPGPMAGFYQVEIRGSSGPQTQDETFYISYDGQKIVRGVVYDINQNPFKPELDKIRTELRPSIGTPGAPVVIAEFSDFECPYCRDLAKTLRDNLLKTYPKEVRLYFFDFPLQQIHPWAKPAAMAGRCIFHQSAAIFQDYSDWIFEHQGDVTADNFNAKVLEFAKTKDKDLNTDQLSSCIDSKADEAEV
jgi:protein-disulfide isomerase